jgi:hypothetical protein
MLPGNERHDVERGGKSKLIILQHMHILILYLYLSLYRETSWDIISVWILHKRSHCLLGSYKKLTSSFPLDCIFHYFAVKEAHFNTLYVTVIMPPSALDQLTRLNIVYPMLFKLTNKRTNRITHSGVLEFVADEGKVYLPYWV